VTFPKCFFKPILKTFVVTFPKSCFELIEFAVIFLYRGPEDDDNAQLAIGDEYELEVVVHRFHGGTKLGTAYPKGF
jgi:hypothetical protein